MDDLVRGGDVGVAGVAEAWSVDLLGYGLTAQPVAIVVSVTYKNVSASFTIPEPLRPRVFLPANWKT